MADALITDLALRATLDGTEEVPVNVPGTPDADAKITAEGIKTYVQNDLGTAAFEDSTAFATAAQGSLADSAVQPGDLGTAAYEAATAFATAAQGTLADTAVQPGDLGTAAYANTGDFATSAQGAKADTALQPAEVKNANFTAANDGLYVVVANATVTDPSPTEGKGYTVVVRNGTATIGGTGYSTAGSQIRRLFHSGGWGTYVDVLTTDSRLTDSRTPTAHASSHVGAGSDKIRDATASQDGLMTAAYATKLDGIEALADVTDAANVGSAISGAATETTLADTDEVAFVTSGGTLKNIAYSSLKTLLNAFYALKGAVTDSGLTMATARLLGRTTASTGAIEEISIGSGLSLAAGVLSATGGGGGLVLQVVQTTLTTTATVTGSTFAEVITRTITPASTSSRILVLAQLSCGNATNNFPYIRLTRGGSVIFQGDAAGSRTLITAAQGTNQINCITTIPIAFVDSPASASSLTYAIELASHSTGAVHLNRSGSDTDGATFARAASSLILVELAS